MPGMDGQGEGAQQSKQLPARPGREVPAENLRKAALQQRRGQNDKENKTLTIFIGGLRKTTDEEKVMAHFSKYGQVDKVDVKRLPDGTSRGFGFVKFTLQETVAKVAEARAHHMIDNKWVAVVPRDGDEYGSHRVDEIPQHTRIEGALTVKNKRMKEQEAANATQEAPQMREGYEEAWSEIYLQVAAQLSQQAMSSQESAGDEAGAAAQETDASTMNMTPEAQQQLMQIHIQMQTQQQMQQQSPMAS